jgi:hypothetical protein
MSGFNAFTYNNNPISNSFYDIASINLPTESTYTINEYNILAPLENGIPGYVLETSNNLISIDSAGGFSINNIGIYKISLCFAFFNSNADSDTIIADVIFNGDSVADNIVSQNNILSVNACGNGLQFRGLTNKSISTTLSDSGISNVDFETGTSEDADGFSPPNPKTYTYNMQPSVMYFSTAFQENEYTPPELSFFFARYYLATTGSTLVPQLSYFNAIVNITSTSDQSNYFYPCICPYAYTIWNAGNNNLSKPYLMVQMISNTPF